MLFINSNLYMQVIMLIRRKKENVFFRAEKDLSIYYSVRLQKRGKVEQSMQLVKYKTY